MSLGLPIAPQEEDEVLEVVRYYAARNATVRMPYTKYQVLQYTRGGYEVRGGHSNDASPTA